MKQLAVIILLSLGACNRASSPEGRSQMRDEKMQKEIDCLKDQNKAILDSINLINKELRHLKNEGC